jgi:glycogen operon protein
MTAYCSTKVRPITGDIILSGFSRYAHEREQALREFKEMVARLHDAGLEVILDVVYNHTAEGNRLGPTLSFKGIDNASYYRLLPEEPRYYIHDTGTGNTLNLDHMRVIEMVTDSLRGLERGHDKA